MRPLILALTLSGAILAAASAAAAPTCQNQAGHTTRCGTPGAMPVGWILPPEARAERDAAASADPTMAQMCLPIFLVCGLLGLISAMPDFDGWRASDWDPQEDDDE